MNIYCCKCDRYILARRTDGREVYPRSPDISHLPFWICDACKSFVGCTPRTANKFTPSGNIAHAELKKARRHLRDLLDPLWQNKLIKRAALYRRMSDELGFKYLTGSITSVEQARLAYYRGLQIRKELYNE